MTTCDGSHLLQALDGGQGEVTQLQINRAEDKGAKVQKGFPH